MVQFNLMASNMPEQSLYLKTNADELASAKKRSIQFDDGRCSKSTESTGPPRKRKKSDVLSPESLFKELTGLESSDRIKRHALAYIRYAPAAPQSSEEQISEIFRLAQEDEKGVEFGILFKLILDTTLVERMIHKARIELVLDNEAPDPPLSEPIINKWAPHIRESRSRDAIRQWLTRTRKLLQLADYLPFMSLKHDDTVTPWKIERLAKKEIQQLLGLLSRDPRARNLGKVGRAFRACVLKRESFVWEHINLTRLQEVPQESMLHLLTIRRDDQSSRTWEVNPNKWDMCEDNRCKLIALDQDLASQQSATPASKQFLCTDVNAQHGETDTGTHEASEFRIPSSNLTTLQAKDDHPSAVVQTLPSFRRISDASSSTTVNKNTGGGNYPILTSEALPSITSSTQTPGMLPQPRTRKTSSHLAHWQQYLPSELLAIPNMIPETVIRTTAHPATMGELKDQSETSQTLQTLSESRVERVSQISSQNPEREPKALFPTIFCGLHDVNTAWTRSFVDNVIRTRTLLHTTSYELILPMSMHCGYVRTATRLVVSLYTQTSVSLRHNAASLFADGMKQTQDKPEQALAILLLYVHYCVVRQAKWTAASRFLAYQQKQGIRLERYPLALFTIYECILNIFNKSPVAHEGLSIAWLQQVQNSYQVLDLGLCPRLLFFIGRITELALQPSPDLNESKQILLETEQLQQIVCGADEEASLVAGQIATTYQLSAQLLAYIRLFGYTPNREEVRLKVSELAELLFQLPTESSPLHRAMDPLFSVVVCSCLTCDEAVANGLMDRSLGLRRGMKSNVSLAMAASVWMRSWVKKKVSGTVQRGWFELLRNSIPRQYCNISLG